MGTRYARLAYTWRHVRSQETSHRSPVLEFTFNDINLPHSGNHEPASHGFVKFRARTFSDLENGIQVNNNAAIYFDYNHPIITNTVQNTISDMVLIYNPLNTVSFLPEKIIVYPNPTSGLVRVEANLVRAIEVYAVNGTLLATTNENSVDLSQYPGGIYLFKVITANAVAIKKIILN